MNPPLLFDQLRNLIIDKSECPICLEVIKDSRMCPVCRKCGCEKCFNDSIQRTKKCPMCRGDILPENLIKLNLVDDLAEIAKSLCNNFNCNQHENPIEYFCIQCNKQLCRDCIIIDKHQNDHNIITMKDYSSEEFTKLNKNIERIDDEIEYINSTLIGKLYSAIDNAKSEKKTKVDKMKMIITNIENKYEEIIEDLESVINDTMNIVDTLLSHKNELKKLSLDFSQKKKEEDYKNQIKFLENDIHYWLTISNVKKQNAFFQINNLVPQVKYYTFDFTIPNFQEILNRKFEMFASISSPWYYLDFLSWKIHVFPWSEGEYLNKYIGIFVELKESDYENLRKAFSYKISLKNRQGQKDYNILYEPKTNGQFSEKRDVEQEQQNNENKQIQHIEKKEPVEAKEPKIEVKIEEIAENIEKKNEKQNNDKENYSVGCFNFYELNNLKKNGFLDENDTLTIKCEVKPENFEYFEDSINLFFSKKDNNHNININDSFLLFNN